MARPSRFTPTASGAVGFVLTAAGWVGTAAVPAAAGGPPTAGPFEHAAGRLGQSGASATGCSRASDARTVLPKLAGRPLRGMRSVSLRSTPLLPQPAARRTA